MNSTRTIALVTGANKGLGLEISRQLATNGIKVLMGSRDEKRGKAAADSLKKEGLDVEFILLDVAKSSDITNVKSKIEKDFNKLDILINNAGIQSDGGWMENTAATVSMDILKKTFDTNFFGLIEITNALLPLLNKSKSGRIVNMSSIMASLTLHADPTSPIYGSKPFAYDASKTAVNQFTVHLAHALSDTNIKVNSAHPGWVKTELGTEYAPMDVVEGAKTAVELASVTNDVPNGKFIHLGQALPW